jgi:hypothetical protein
LTFITPLSTAARSSSGDDPLEPWKTYWKRAPACVRAQVLLERQRRAIEHVRVERSASAAGACTSSLSTVWLCVTLWTRAKTVDQDERGNAERRALIIGLWPPMLWLMGDTLERHE